MPNRRPQRRSWRCLRATPAIRERVEGHNVCREIASGLALRGLGRSYHPGDIAGVRRVAGAGRGTTR